MSLSPTTSSILGVSTVRATPELEVWGWVSIYELNHLLSPRELQLEYSIPQSPQHSCEGAQGFFLQGYFSNGPS